MSIKIDNGNKCLLLRSTIALHTREWGDVLYNDTGIDLSGACIIDVQTLSQGICTCILAHTHTHTHLLMRKEEKNQT